MYTWCGRDWLSSDSDRQKVANASKVEEAREDPKKQRTVEWWCVEGGWRTRERTREEIELAVDGH